MLELSSLDAVAKDVVEELDVFFRMLKLQTHAEFNVATSVILFPISEIFGAYLQLEKMVEI